MNTTSTQEYSPKVLIVEDDTLMRVQLRRVMEQAGYQVAEASDGKQGLDVYHSYHPDIVLLEAVMPVMDGFTFCTQLQADSLKASTPVLMLTALDDEESVNRAFDAGASDYINKPINWAVLRQRVRRILQASRAIQELQQQSLRERLIRGITQRIRQSLHINEILDTTVAEVREFLACDRVLFYRVGSDGSGKVVSEAVVPGCIKILGQNITDPCFQETYLPLYRQGRIRAIADIEQADLQPCHVEFLQQFGVKANLIVPILQGEALWGLLLAQHCTSSRAWSSFDIELLQQLASQLSIALAQAQHLETIQESEERFRQLAENIREVFFLATPDQMLYISPVYEEIWGCTRQSIYQDLSAWMDIVHPEDCDRIATAWNQQRQSGKAVNEEYRIVRNDGSIRWIRCRTFPIWNEQGDLYRITGIAEDITERKQVEEEMRQALEKEKELGELKSRFVTLTSHQFRTPLSTILSSAELLQHYGHKWNENKKGQHLHRIQEAVQNMIHLLNDVLIIGKAEAGKLEFNPSYMNLSNFCRDLVEEMQFNTSNSNHVINFGTQGDCNIFYMDKKLLYCILTNLLLNAIKYSPQGDKINFELVCEPEKVVFRIQDKGIGILADEQLQIFRPFERGSNVSNISGTGLGLAIVKKCVDLHGGNIIVNSEVGVGTTFLVTVPSVLKSN